MKKNSLFLRMLALVFALMMALSFTSLAETDDPALAEGADIRIMSFNLMNPDWSLVKVTERAPKAAELILYYQPDVVGVQEANSKWHKALKPILVDTGLYTPACRQSNAEGFKYNMTSFLYNNSTVKLVDEYILDLDRNSDIRVLAVAVFEKLSDGSRFVVTNTHPASSTDEYDYAKHCADFIRLGGEELQKYADLPVFMTGDFNTDEQDDMYQQFLQGLNVRDAKYEADVLVRNCSTYFGWPSVIDTTVNDCAIDHIFVNGHADVKLFSAVISHEVETITDHLPIYADIAFQ